MSLLKPKRVALVAARGRRPLIASVLLPQSSSLHESCTNTWIPSALVRIEAPLLTSAWNDDISRSGHFLDLTQHFKHEDEGAGPKMAKRLLNALDGSP
jgi:hypothetical protein